MITMADFMELTKNPGTWAVFVQHSGFCVCAPVHGQPHEILHSRGLNKEHAELIVRNWSAYAPRMVDEAAHLCDGTCAVCDPSQIKVQP